MTDQAANVGYCNCCRQTVLFKQVGDWLRDEYLCENCKSIPRQRHLSHILDSHFAGWEKKLIHESSPSNTFISQFAKHYSSSHYLGDVTPGGYSEDGTRSEDLEKLTLPKESVDIFITQDVLEHVFHPDRAAREINRVLRPGGIHIFTTPKYEDLEKSFPRCSISEEGEVTHMHEPEYHGNPIGDGRSLVTWHFGQDFEQLLAGWTGSPVTTYVTRDRTHGIDAKFNEVFVAHKPK